MHQDAGDAAKPGPAVQPDTRSETAPPPSRGDRWQLLAVGASIIIAVSGVVSLIVGVVNSGRAADAQVQLLALGHVQHYLDQAVEHPDLASRGNDLPVDARYGWFAAEALSTAQTLWLLVGQHADWQGAVRSIVRQHQPYLRSGAFVCDDFAPGFVSYLRERTPELKCAAPANAP